MAASVGQRCLRLLREVAPWRSRYSTWRGGLGPAGSGDRSRVLSPAHPGGRSGADGVPRLHLSSGAGPVPPRRAARG